MLIENQCGTFFKLLLLAIFSEIFHFLYENINFGRDSTYSSNLLCLCCTKCSFFRLTNLQIHTNFHLFQFRWKVLKSNLFLLNCHFTKLEGWDKCLYWYLTEKKKIHKHKSLDNNYLKVLFCVWVANSRANSNENCVKL